MAYDPGALNASLAAAVGSDSDADGGAAQRLHRERRAPARPDGPLALRRQLGDRRRAPQEHRRELRRRRPDRARRRGAGRRAGRPGRAAQDRRAPSTNSPPSVSRTALPSKCRCGLPTVSVASASGGDEVALAALIAAYHESGEAGRVCARPCRSPAAP